MEGPKKKGQKAPRDYVQSDLPGMPFFRDTPAGASGMLLRTAADVFSRWYSALNGAVEREKERQRDYRKEHGYKAGAKVSPMPLSPSDSEESVAKASESVIRAMFGDSVADYARDKFLNAISTGDKRSFKIRLLMLKARDSLKGLMHDEFSRYVDIYISDAESAAGCKESPHGPRRLSRAEKAKKQRRESYEKACAFDLFSYVESEAKHQPDIQDIDASVEADPHGDSNFKILKTPILEEQRNSPKPVDAGPKAPIAKKDEGYGNDPKSVTVTHNSVTVTHNTGVVSPEPTAAKRKYERASEILEDVKSGRITMYGSPSDIVSDMRSGVLSPSEAMMFLSAYGKMADQKKSGRSRKRKVRDVEIPSDDDLDRDERGFSDGYEQEEEEVEADEGRCQEDGWSQEDDW